MDKLMNKPWKRKSLSHRLFTSLPTQGMIWEQGFFVKRDKKGIEQELIREKLALVIERKAVFFTRR